jgi:hypothetical protein
MHLLRPEAHVADILDTGDGTSAIDEIAGADIYEPLMDSSTLFECGIGDGDLLLLLVRPIEWSESELAIQQRVRGCGATLDLSESGLGQRAISALVWTMTNEVASLALFTLLVPTRKRLTHKTASRTKLKPLL